METVYLDFIRGSGVIGLQRGGWGFLQELPESLERCRSNLDVLLNLGKRSTLLGGRLYGHSLVELLQIIPGQVGALGGAGQSYTQIKGFDFVSAPSNMAGE